MATPQKPWKAEYAKSGRSSCRTCKNTIEKENFRLGKMVQSSQFDGLMPMWNHADCILKKANQIQSHDDVEGIESLRWDDQQKIRKYIEGGGPSKTTSASYSENSIEASPTSRATCKHCSQKIMKGEVRLSIKPDGQGARSLAWHHAKCFLEMFPSTQVEKLSGWNTLSDSDQATVRALAKKVPSIAESVEVKKDKDIRQSTSKGGSKRKKEASVDSESKVVKAEGDVAISRARRGASGKNILKKI